MNKTAANNRWDNYWGRNLKSGGYLLRKSIKNFAYRIIRFFYAFWNVLFNPAADL